MARKKVSKKKVEPLEEQPEPEPEISSVDQKKEQINAFLAKLRKETPGARVGFAGDAEMREVIEYSRIPSGIPQFDEILDGGIPENKFTVFTGASAAGKSSMAYQIIGHNQRADPDAIWAIADTENSYDPEWAETLGVDQSRLIFIETDIMEDVLQRVIDISRSGHLTGVLIDSLGALLPRAEVEDPGSKPSAPKLRNLRQENVTVMNRKLGQFYRMATPAIAKARTACILIAHVYTDIGAYAPRGEVLKTKGGHSTQHFAHMRVGFRRAYNKEKEVMVKMPDGKEKKVTSGFDTAIRIEKTKQGTHEGHEVYIPFTYGVGFDSRECIINAAFVRGIVEARGAWYYHPDFPEGRIQGKSKAANYVLGNDGLYNKVLNDVIRFASQSDELKEQEEKRVSTNKAGSAAPPTTDILSAENTPGNP